VSLLDRIRLWLDLVRFSHTVFALPFALAGLLVGSGGWPSWKVLALVLLCMATARNAAMAWNRLVDRDIDAANPRTAKRHLPAGLVTPGAVVVFTAANAALFVAGAWLLNPLCLWLSPVALLLVLGYSHVKRFSALCHVVLGLAIGISPTAAGIAASGQFLAACLWLSAALWAWISGFDIVYSTQDAGFDRERGLHSIPAALGEKGALLAASGLHVVVPVALFLAGRSAGWGLPWHLVVLAVSALLLRTHLQRGSRDLDLQSSFFRLNGLVSLLVLAGAAWETLVRR
jgi:4-hydroxybenzoate polyprenyltransferase